MILIDEVDYDSYHCVFLLGATFSYPEGESYEGMVGDALSTPFVIKDSIAFDEPQKLYGVIS